ncbi:NACHT, LRR and PYD domains-containing protein 1 homolog [Rhinichthys klamathensis goyatoka]|uniref:NACHT, LRR and PYD domains-containing protein 1 homolog n=1 Tax=Rhinichthys klamathensis goyatoka TaxID=3034132 RepID=UPI0024B5B1F5|nr:NACHT, LRR and PYD domains-containing protein 1 homolog [Rhinichthys klamathensis goyatoka]
MDQHSERARLVDDYWAKLVQRVQMVMPIADELRSGGMLEYEPYCKIRAADTNQEKMREFYKVLHSGGDKVKFAFYSRLEKHEPSLFSDLGFTGHNTHSEKTHSSESSPVIDKYMKRIRSEYQYVTEYNSLPGEHVLLSERFTQPLILQKHRDRIEREEEIRSSGERFQQVLSSRSSGDSVQLSSLFDPDDHGISPSSVILQGNSGNGKSFTVQKIMMDWASGVLYKGRFDIVFHLKCKEINRIPGEKSLVEILSCSCSLTSHEISQILQQSPEKVLVVIDGFDELKLPQDINDTSAHTDLLQKARPVDTLCALLRGRILPESFLLVSSRSTATDTLSKLLKGPQRFSEIVGFSEKGVEEYFRKFFQKKKLFREAYTYVKANESLITACSIPVVCWIICTTIQERFKYGANKTSGLETTTSIYVDFVCTLLKHHSQGLSQSVPTLLRSLGQLAERGMQEQQVLLDEDSVNETISDPAGNPFLCKFLFKRRIYQETMFSFMHLSFQEFFCALYYVLLDEKESLGKLLMDSSSKPRFAAVVQFAFGLLNKDVRLTLKEHGLFIRPKTQAHLKEWILEKVKGFSLCSEAVLIVLHCLCELHEEDFVKEAMGSWKRIDLHGPFLSRADFCALLFCSQCCQRIEGIYSLYLTSEYLSMILPELHKFKEASLTILDPSVSDLGELINTLTRGQTLSSQRVCVRTLLSLDLSINKEPSSTCTEIVLLRYPDLESFSLTFPHSEIFNIDWTRLFQIIHRWDLDALLSVLHSFSNLKKMEMSVKCLTEKLSVWTLQMSQNCPSLTELTLDAGILQEDGIEILKSSNTRPSCMMTFIGSICNKQFKKYPHYDDDFWSRLKDHQSNCCQKVRILLNDQGFSMETL